MTASAPLVDPGFAQTMARYNAEMNRRLIAAAGRLPDAERRRDRGAFWRSIHGTFSHLVWADRMWMSRFAGWDKPSVGIRESDHMIADFETLRAERPALDARLIDWAARLDPAWIAGDLVWFSGAMQREMRQPKGFLLVHFFNHQTHHRGQIHAMLTAAGEATGDTDLFIVEEP